MIQDPKIIPLFTGDSITSLITGTFITGIGVFVIKMFFKFKEDVAIRNEVFISSIADMKLEIVTKLTEISTKLNNLDGEVDLLREYKNKFDSIQSTVNLHGSELMDHEVRIRDLEQREPRKG